MISDPLSIVVFQFFSSFNKKLNKLQIFNIESSIILSHEEFRGIYFNLSIGENVFILKKIGQSCISKFSHDFEVEVRGTKVVHGLRLYF